MSTHVSPAFAPSKDSTPPSAGLSVYAKVGRAVFALPFAIFGLNHLTHASQMAGYVPVPGGAFWVYFTGVALIAGAVGLLTGILGKWAALGLAALMLVFVATIHIPGLMHAESQMMSTIGLLKDLSLAGGALTWAGIFAKQGK